MQKTLPLKFVRSPSRSITKDMYAVNRAFTDPAVVLRVHVFAVIQLSDSVRSRVEANLCKFFFIVGDPFIMRVGILLISSNRHIFGVPRPRFFLLLYRVEIFSSLCHHGFMRKFSLVNLLIRDHWTQT